MSLTTVDHRQLRNFGLLIAAFLLIVFGLALPFFEVMAFRLWPWLVAASLVLLALLVPGWLRWPYGLWMQIGHLLGLVSNFLLLAVVFYLVILPTGLLLRLLGRRPIRDCDRNQDSYRKPAVPPDFKNFKRPF